MAMLRIRLTGPDDAARAVMNLLQSLDGIEHVEEVDDLMPHMDDPDSSSAGLTDNMGPGTHLVLVNAKTDDDIRRALEVAESCAREMGIALEVVSDE